MIVTPKVEANTDMMMHDQKPSMALKSPPFAPISADAVSSSTPNNSRPVCRRRIAFHPTLGYPIPPTVAPKVARRNARERNRVKQVNCGFEMLRSHIPTAAKAKKMSKVDTLRHAVEYIQNLQQMIDEQHLHQHHQQQLPIDTMGSHMPMGQQTPTHSSRDSTVPSPMTPHLQQSHHFILPDPPTYPSPLTPRTPNTPMSADYLVPTNGYTPSCNDSGFDTSSFFSANSSMTSNLMSPNCQRPMSQQHLMQNNHLQGQQHRDHSPVSGGNYIRSSSSHHYTNVDHSITSQYYNYNAIIAESPEEEELLDAISKWQDQDD